MLSSAQINIIIDVLKPYNPKKIGLFGSVARNEDNPESDVDILYSFTKPITLFKSARIKNLLEEKLNRKVDFISENAVHPLLKDSVYSDLKIIYGG